MKGVSEIIAIILILMIVIALAALAYTWFSGVFASMTGSANAAIATNTQEMTTQFRIEAARFTFYNSTCCTNVTIRNIGTQNFNAALSAAYIGSISAAYGGPTGTSTVTPTTPAVIYNITNSTAACGNTVMITIGSGLTDSRVISC